MFLVAGLLELPGRRVFGFLINLPVVSYYEIGTAPTANQRHAAMMGVYVLPPSAWRCSARAT